MLNPNIETANLYDLSRRSYGHFLKNGYFSGFWPSLRILELSRWVKGPASPDGDIRDRRPILYRMVYKLTESIFSLYLWISCILHEHVSPIDHPDVWIEALRTYCNEKIFQPVKLMLEQSNGHLPFPLTSDIYLVKYDPTQMEWIRLDVWKVIRELKIWVKT